MWRFCTRDDSDAPPSPRNGRAWTWPLHPFAPYYFCLIVLLSYFNLTCTVCKTARLTTPVHKQQNKNHPTKTLVLRKIIVYYLNETLLEMLQLCNPTAERNWNAHCSETKKGLMIKRMDMINKMIKRMDMIKLGQINTHQNLPLANIAERIGNK